MTGERPRVRPATSTLTAVVRASSLVITAAGLVATLVAWPSLPAVIPVHWNAGGDVDGEGPRWMVLVLAAVWLLLVGGLAWLSRHPRAFNYPVEVTDENAARVYGAGVALIAWITACITAACGALMLMSFGVDAAVVLGFALVGTLAVVIAGISRIIHAARPVEPSSSRGS